MLARTLVLRSADLVTAVAIQAELKRRSIGWNVAPSQSSVRVTIGSHWGMHAAKG